MTEAVLFYRTITPLHMGADNVLGLVDLPIQREKHTNIPKMEASGIKGVYRALFNEIAKDEDEDVKKLFGEAMQEIEEGGVQEGQAGNLIFYDAKLLLFPVISKEDFFVWVTCPFVLTQFIENTGMWSDYKDAIEKVNWKEGKAIPIRSGSDETVPEKVLINDYIFELGKSITLPLQDLYDHSATNINHKLQHSIYMVENEIFAHFCDTCTEIHTRIRIGENGVVVDGALFTEEFLPEQCFLYEKIADFKDKKSCLPIFLDHMQKYSTLQFGGDSTIGKGLTKITIAKTDNNKQEEKRNLIDSLDYKNFIKEKTKMIQNAIPNDERLVFNVQSYFQSRLAVGLKNKTPDHNELIYQKDHVTNAPILPASSIKGVFSHFCNEYNCKENNKNAQIDYETWFGSEEQAGKITFYDAIPSAFEIINDYITPHYSKYYSNGPDYLTYKGEPIPIPFECVEIKDMIIVLCCQKEIKEEVKKKFKKCLEECSFGAKGAVGYGYFKIKDK